MPPRVVSRRAVAAFFLARHHLARPRRGPGGSPPPPGWPSRRTSARLQIDSINVVERAHYLTLWSR